MAIVKAASDDGDEVTGMTTGHSRHYFSHFPEPTGVLLIDVSGAGAHRKIPQIFVRRLNSRAYELPVMD